MCSFVMLCQQHEDRDLLRGSSLGVLLCSSPICTDLGALAAARFLVYCCTGVRFARAHFPFREFSGHAVLRLHVPYIPSGKLLCWCLHERGTPLETGFYPTYLGAGSLAGAFSALSAHPRRRIRSRFLRSEKKVRSRVLGRPVRAACVAVRGLGPEPSMSIDDSSF